MVAATSGRITCPHLRCTSPSTAALPVSMCRCSEGSPMFEAMIRVVIGSRELEATKVLCGVVFCAARTADRRQRRQVMLGRVCAASEPDLSVLVWFEFEPSHHLSLSLCLSLSHTRRSVRSRPWHTQIADRNARAWASKRSRRSGSSNCYSRSQWPTILIRVSRALGATIARSTRIRSHRAFQRGSESPSLLERSMHLRRGTRRWMSKRKGDADKTLRRQVRLSR